MSVGASNVLPDHGSSRLPLFEIADGELNLFQRLTGADIYEKEIEDLLWNNLEEFTGEALFPVRRQAKTSVWWDP